ncbi:MAG: PP2C family protein-serine/threonine phosphatase [Acidobacteriota bacterium]
MRPTRGRLLDFVETYTRGLTADDLGRLFTRDTRDAYWFFTRGADRAAFAHLPWYSRALAHVRLLFIAFTMKLSPARRVVYAAALLFTALGLFSLFRRGARIAGGSIAAIGPGFPDGTAALVVGFVLLNLLVLLEVADRLSLKNDLEIAREIQQAMLPKGAFTTPTVEMIGMSRPANTVGGDFYDIIPLDQGRIVVAVGDVAGKGSPAALLMALLLAMLRTLVDERLEPAALVTRLNTQVSRHAPGTRFITLLYGVYDSVTGVLTYVNAGHMPPLLLRRDGSCERLSEGGVALGMFDGSVYTPGHATICSGDLLAIYSDGITEAENPRGVPFEEAGLEALLRLRRHDGLASLGAGIVRGVEQYSADARLADDLTIFLLRRTGAAGPAPEA